MKTYVVTYEGRIREIYLVEAKDEVEAREIWSKGAFFGSEVIDGEVTDVQEDE